MEFQVNQNIKFKKNVLFEEKIKEIKIQKYHQTILPTCYRVSKEPIDEVTDMRPYSKKKGILLERKEHCLIDFGDHSVGRVKLKINTKGSPPDAPAKIRLIFGETLIEVLRDPNSYQGELSSSWIQEELLTIDVLPTEIELSRRFSFRYIKIEVIDTSPKFDLKMELTCITESSANIDDLKLIETDDQLLRDIDRVSQKTLVQCMQDVFEDGPKRDRRLWLGDLRLQALANYSTFQVNDLVKKCLYLFATQTTIDNQVSANIYIHPHLIPDDTFLADYSLFFIDTLLSYYKETNDSDVLSDLYPIAVNQMRILDNNVESNGEVISPKGWWAFIDWNEKLEKQVAIQGIFIYSYKKLLELATIMSDKKLEQELQFKVDSLERWTMENCFSEEQKLFIDPTTQQVSIPSQTWMVLAKIGSPQFRKSILEKILITSKNKLVGCNTPYMYHHFAEALFQEGLFENAIQLVKEYWGGMIKEGADTFWEVYNPEDPMLSPYGDMMINSFCHAWSCTPCYLFRKYIKE